LIAMIACKARNGTIGKDGKMPWHLPADLAYFKTVTSGHTVVMGRKTFESIGKPLPKRRNIVLSRDPEFNATGCEVFRSIDPVLDLAKQISPDPVFIIGGAEMYRLFLPYADRLYITEIDEEFEGDTVLFDITPNDWALTSCVDGVQDERNPYRYRFLIYERC
jgi:dihydrofolate reductase